MLNQNILEFKLQSSAHFRWVELMLNTRVYTLAKNLD